MAPPTLPPELIAIIFSHLPFPSYTDLASCCLASFAFLELASPILYGKVVIKRDEDLGKLFCERVSLACSRDVTDWLRRKELKREWLFSAAGADLPSPCLILPLGPRNNSSTPSPTLIPPSNHDPSHADPPELPSFAVSSPSALVFFVFLSIFHRQILFCRHQGFVYFAFVNVHFRSINDIRRVMPSLRLSDRPLLTPPPV
jgi:hypothetical protein